MFAALTPGSINIYRTLREAVVFADNWNFFNRDVVARVYQPTVACIHDDLSEVIAEPDDEKYRRELSSLAMQIRRKGWAKGGAKR